MPAHENNTITKHLEIRAKRSAVFQALTDPEAMKAYFPINDVVAEWKVGGALTFVGEESGTDEGVIDVLDSDSCFQFSYWNENHGRERHPENLVTISYVLAEDREKTMLTLRQTNLPFPRYQALMDPVWDSILERLKKHVEDPR